jgi:branched-chain amino acid transport system ATP-binding protein
LLSIRDLSISFSGLRALSDVSFDVEERQIFGLIGPNGAGKSTLLNCVTRLYRPDAGQVRYRDHDLLAHQVHDLPALGIKRTFQNLELYKQFSVRENVILDTAFRYRGNLLAELFRLPSSVRGQRKAEARADRLLSELAIAQYADAIVSTLPYGVQKTVELARALASEPKLLLLDEPAAGMNVDESRRVGDTIRSLRDDHGITVILVEHDMSLVMSVCEKIAVLDHGELIALGAPAEVRKDPDVIAAYLGEDVEDA